MNYDLINTAFKGWIGTSKKDITPPIGIYSKNWGAGNSDRATGIHKPLFLTCLTFQQQPNEKPVIIIGADLGWWKTHKEEQLLRKTILEKFDLNESNLLFCLSHTHAGPSLTLDDAQKNGGEFIEEYLNNLALLSIEAINEALIDAELSILDWRTGTCDLATNRDLFHQEKNKYYVGFNPNEQTDQTILLGRVTSTNGALKALLVNYACHPTTLAWENTLISPDYIGAMRELVESYTNSNLLFIQGASGNTAPALQYSGSTELADKHGRQLGFSILSILNAFNKESTILKLESYVESGAPLAIWKENETTLSNSLKAFIIHINVNLKNLPELEVLIEEHNNCLDQVTKERLFRKIGLRQKLGNGNQIDVPIWIVQIGKSYIVAQNNELYIEFQEIIRKVFPESPILIGNVVNGYVGYIVPEKYNFADMYSFNQSPFDAGSFELILQHTIDFIHKLN